VAGVYNVDLQAQSSGMLPSCNSTTQGETAFVASPPALERCVGVGWENIPCTTLLSGVVAYDSATQTLWACTQ
jgi:hypothetical protein